MGPTSEGVRIGRGYPDFIRPNETLRPLRDQLIVRPLEWDPSPTLTVIRSGKPVRGVVIAAGPGAYRRDYSKDRKRTWLTDTFIPTTVKPGEIVELGGLEIDGYDFPTVFIEGMAHLIVTERDVCMIRDDLSAARQ